MNLRYPLGIYTGSVPFRRTFGGSKDGVIQEVTNFAELMQSAHDAILEVSEDGTIAAVNTLIETMFGYRREEILGQKVELLLPELLRAGHAQLRAGYQKAPVMRPMGRALTFPGRRKDGTEIPLEMSLIPLKANDGRIIVCIVRDVTERRETEERLRASLKEKEILLREVHHRVKNNLQIISSLLSLQAKFFADERDVDKLRETQARIRTFALVHERLYFSGELAQIEMRGYLRALVNEIGQSCGRTGIFVDVLVHDVSVSMDQAVLCGLIVNELVSNALKHAFPGDRQGRVQVVLRRLGDSHMELIVRDDGIGIPGSISLDHPATLGLELVKGVATQMGGKIELRTQHGTEFRICCGGS